MEHAAERPQFGSHRLTMFVGRDGSKMNHEHVYRIHKERDLIVRREETQSRFTCT